MRRSRRERVSDLVVDIDLCVEIAVEPVDAHAAEAERNVPAGPAAAVAIDLVSEPAPTLRRYAAPSRQPLSGRGDRTDRSELLTPAEAARKLGVTPNTVTRWSRDGKISAIQTMGGHRRFRRSEIERLLGDSSLVASGLMPNADN